MKITDFLGEEGSREEPYSTAVSRLCLLSHKLRSVIGQLPVRMHTGSRHEVRGLFPFRFQCISLSTPSLNKPPHDTIHLETYFTIMDDHLNRSLPKFSLAYTDLRLYNVSLQSETLID